MRTLVNLTETQIQALDRTARAHDRSRAALIREAIDDYIARHPVTDPKMALEDAFGLWGPDGEDGLAYQERLRAEWPR